MDQFKKLYKPIIKPLKPGEKRLSPSAINDTLNQVDDRVVAPKFDFAKKFAVALIEKAGENKVGEEGSVSNTGRESLINNDEEGGLINNDGEKSLINNSKEKSLVSNWDNQPTSLTANPALEILKDKALPFKFTPIGKPNLNLGRGGLLGRAASVSVDTTPSAPLEPATVDFVLPSASGSSIWEEEIKLSSALDDDRITDLGLDIISESEYRLDQPPVTKIEESTPAETLPAMEPIIKATEFRARHLLDEALLECRKVFLQVEQAIDRLEIDLPIGLRALDDQIGVLHDVKLEFMLDDVTPDSQMLDALKIPSL